MAAPLQTWATQRDSLERELVQAHRMDILMELAPGIAHDLNNPLAAIIAFSQLIRRDPGLPDDLRESADLLIQEAQRTRQLVDRFLDFACAQPSDDGPTDLASVISSSLDLQAHQISMAGVRVDVDLPEDLPPVGIDRAAVQQVLMTLIFDAVEQIRTRREGGAMRLTAAIAGVDDRTIQVTVAHDASPERATVDRSSLALAVCEQIVEAHGGRLNFRPPTDGQAWFLVELPMDPAGHDGAMAAPWRSDPGSPDGRTLVEDGRPRVLVIDDEPSIRHLLAKALSIAGAEAVLAEDGQSAVDLLGQESVDAVLCDHHMGGMSGRGAYDAIVAARPELASRFVIMTGDVGDRTLRAFADERGIELLAKPFDIQAVGRMLRSVLEKEEAQPPG